MPLRTSFILFLTCFLGYAYFHQGGGWNQNTRFDQVRAIVETGRLDINDYLLYAIEVDSRGAPRYQRLVLSDPQTRSQRMPRANTLDISFREGRYYPNKPPGVSFLCAPIYFAIYGIERALGVDPDAWWILTLNGYLTTLLFSGFAGAACALLFFAMSGALFPDSSHGVRIAATLAFAFGTMLFPFSTILADHVPVAALYLLAFALIFRASATDSGRRAALLLFGAGFALGIGLLSNYTALLPAGVLGAYALWRSRPRLRAFWVAAGGILPSLVLLWYHAHCFGQPFAVAHDFQMEIFQTPETWAFEQFHLPDPEVLLELLFLPYRGLCFTSPILLLSAFGIYRTWMLPGRRAEALVLAAIPLLLLLMLASFVGWHGGSVFGPRHLTPALPFLALALVPAFARLPRTSTLLGGVSVGIMFLITAVSPQVSIEVRNPLRDFYLPVASGETVVVEGFSIRGPVSAHPLGMAGGDLEVRNPASYWARWNSFNLGELLFPGSWASVLPLLALLAAAWLFLLRSNRPHRQRIPRRSGAP